MMGWKNQWYFVVGAPGRRPKGLGERFSRAAAALVALHTSSHSAHR